MLMRNYAKTLVAVLLVILSGTSSSAQIFDFTKGKKAEKLINQNLIVCSYGKGAYNQRLTDAFNAYWKVTPFKIYDTKYNLPSFEEGSTIFMPIVYGLKVRDHETSMNNPFYILAGTGSARPDPDMIVAAMPINGFHYEFNVKSDSMYNGSLLRLPYLVYNLNDMISHLKTKGDDKGYFSAIEAKNTRIASKTMLIPSELLDKWDVGPNTMAMMKASLEAGKKSTKSIMHAILERADITYKGKYKIMSSADIMKLEATEEAANYTLFLPAIDNHRYFMVYDLKTKEMLYYDMVKMGMEVKSKDFDKLNKAVGL
jgi:hypothetical protein